jgi:hypothetical protein
MDWHATFRSLAGAKDKAEKPLDGMSVWDAIAEDKESPRTEFLVNLDPCSGIGACQWPASAYHFQGCFGAEACGHWKLIDGAVTEDSWYPVPTSTLAAPASTEAQASQGLPTLAGGVSFPPAPAGNATYLFNISADPGEHTNLADLYPSVVTALKAKVEALGKEALPPCNIEGGSCSAEDPNAAAVLAANGAWVPWVADKVVGKPSTIVV